MRKTIRQNTFEIFQYAKQEIDNVRSVYKWLASILGIIIVFGASLIAFFSYNNIKDVRNEMQNETDRIAKNVNERLDLIKEKIQFDLEKEVYLVERGVKERIDAEFDKDNIQKLVTNTADEKINLYANEIIKTRMINDVQPLIDETRKNIDSLKERLIKINSATQSNVESAKKDIDLLMVRTRKELDSLETISNFVMTVSSAQAGDRIAWNQLKAWGDNKQYILSNRAADSYAKIMDDYSNLTYAEPFVDSLKFTQKVDVKTLTYEMMTHDYNFYLSKNSSYYVRLQFIKHIWERKDFSLKNRLSFLVEVLKNDRHLLCIRYAGRLFTEETKQEIKYLATDYLVDWWEKNKMKYDK